MCLAVVAVAAMLVVGGGGAAAAVEEAAMEAAEEADDVPGGWWLCSVYSCRPIVLSPSRPPAPKAEAMLRSLADWFSSCVDQYSTLLYQKIFFKCLTSLHNILSNFFLTIEPDTCAQKSSSFLP